MCRAYSDVQPALRVQTRVRIFTNPRLTERVLEWRPISERVALVRLKLKEKTLALVQVCALNTELECAPLSHEVFAVLEGIRQRDSGLLMGDLNAYLGKRCTDVERHN